MVPGASLPIRRLLIPLLARTLTFVRVRPVFPFESLGATDDGQVVSWTLVTVELLVPSTAPPGSEELEFPITHRDAEYDPSSPLASKQSLSVSAALYQ